MEIQKIKPIEVSPEDALEVCNMLSQMKKAVQQSIDSRKWKQVDESNLKTIVSDIENSVFQLLHYYFSYNYEDSERATETV